MLMRWDPLRELTSLQRDINRLFDAGSRRTNGFGETGFPAMDISETDSDLKVRALLPGVKKEDVSISLHQNVLSISGEKKLPEPTQGARVLRQEQFQGRFQRTLRLNRPVAADRIRASLKAGVLTLTLPLKEEARPRQIEVAVS